MSMHKGPLTCEVAHRYKDLVRRREGAMSWWYVSDGERRGPVNEDELARLLGNGTVAPNSLLWKAGMKGWEPAASIAELKSLLSALPPEVPRDQTSRLTAWQRLKRHLGSTLALIIGGLSLVSGLARVATLGANSFEPGSSTLQAGVVIILGALAYRSAKKRRIGEAKSTLTRRFLEIASLVLICLVILMQNNLKYLIETDPVPNALIPIWAILAYLAIVVMPKRWLLRSS
jgi:hypothetical protein